MKRFMTRLLTALLAVSIVASMAVGASAIELKTGIGIVESNGLRLRAKPNTDAEILANASYGDNVVIIREVDGWYLVDYNLQIGYMSAEYITFKERENIDLGYGVVEDASVNLRSTPGTDGDLLATLTTGETAYIIGLNCGWYKVQYEGQTGYIRSDLLARKPSDGCWKRDNVDLSALLGQLDPGMIQLGMRLLGEYRGRDDRNAALLSALRPFVREERRSKLDRAIEIARVTRLVRVALEAMGGKGEDGDV